MSVVGYYLRVTCDAPRCPQEILITGLYGKPAVIETAAHCMRELRNSGWGMSGGKYLCERHREELLKAPETRAS